MMESAADFGTGLRAHLGLEQRKFQLLAATVAAPERLAVDETDDETEAQAEEIAGAAPDRATLEVLEDAEAEAEAPTRAEAEGIADAAPDRATLEVLEALETELLERERSLAEREASLAGRAGALLAAAQTLYDEVLGGSTSPTSDEHARLRRRRSVA